LQSGAASSSKQKDFVVTAGLLIGLSKLGMLLHRGDYMADWAMFKMGYKKKEELILNSQESAGSFEETYATLYEDLYSRMPPMPSDE
jgi:hypothetical protein